MTFSEVRERMVPSIKDAASLRLQCGKNYSWYFPIQYTKNSRSFEDLNSKGKIKNFYNKT